MFNFAFSVVISVQLFFKIRKGNAKHETQIKGKLKNVSKVTFKKSSIYACMRSMATALMLFTIDSTSATCM